MTLKPVSSDAPGSPLIDVAARNNEPIAKMTKPGLNNPTLPNMSEMRPNDTRRTEVTRLYPKTIHRRYWKEVSGSIDKPRNIAGSEMSTMVPSIPAISVPTVVFDSATHSYSTIGAGISGCRRIPSLLNGRCDSHD